MLAAYVCLHTFTWTHHHNYPQVPVHWTQALPAHLSSSGNRWETKIWQQPNVQLQQHHNSTKHQVECVSEECVNETEDWGGQSLDSLHVGGSQAGKQGRQSRHNWKTETNNSFLTWNLQDKQRKGGGPARNENSKFSVTHIHKAALCEAQTGNRAPSSNECKPDQC